MVKDEFKYSDMRPIIATYLKYAFHPHYNNNNIYSVKLIDGRYPEVNEILSPLPFEPVPGLNDAIDYWMDSFHDILQEGASNSKLGEHDKIDLRGPGVADENIVMRLLEIFENHFPPLDIQTCDYYSCAEQLTMEFNRLISVNDTVTQQSPKSVVRLLLTLCFDPYYRNLNINRIYNKVRPPTMELCKNLVPKIHTICEGAHHIATLERKAARYRRLGIKSKVNVGEKTTDDYVTDLCGIFNQYFPDVQDDRVIQIGSTIKRYGETDCYLKHIICLVNPKVK